MSRRLRIKDSGLFPEARPAKPFRRAFRFLPASACPCLPLPAPVCPCLPLPAPACPCLLLSAPVCLCLLLPAPACPCLPLSASACPCPRDCASVRIPACFFARFSCLLFCPFLLLAFLPVSPACVSPVSACVSVLCNLYTCLLFLPAFTCVPVGIPFCLLPGFSQHSCGRRPVFRFFRRPLCRPAAVRCDFPPQRSADAPPGLSAGAVCAVRCLEAVVAGECPAEPISRCACFFTGLNFQISFSFRTFARL